MLASKLSPIQKAASVSLSLLLAVALCPMMAEAVEGEADQTEAVAMVEQEVEAGEEMAGEEDPSELEVVDEGEAPLKAVGQEDEPRQEQGDDAMEEDAEALQEDLAESDPILRADGETGDLSFFYSEDENGEQYARVRVSGVTSGTVTFDEATETLALDNATMGDIWSDIPLTINLVGENTCGRITDGYDEDAEMELSITGDGTLHATGLSGYHGGVNVESGTLVVGNNTYYKDGYVSVYGVSAGTASFDEASTTLTLDNADVEEICVDGLLSINLVGGNTCSRWRSTSDSALTIKGGGSFTCSDEYNYGIYFKSLTVMGGKVTLGKVGYYDHYPCDEVKVTGGELHVNDYISSKSLVVSGGKVSASYLYSQPTVKITGGTLAVDEGVDCATLTMTGGTISGYVSCGGNATVSDGTISGYVSCGGNATVSGGTIKGSLSSGSLKMTKGTINGGVTCNDGSVTTSGGTIKGYVSAKTLTVGGSATLISSGSSKDSWSETISCTSLVMKGGTISVSKNHSGLDVSKSITMTGGKISAANCACGLDIGTGSANSSFTMSGGTISASNCDYGIYLNADDSSAYTANMTIKKGAITVSNPSHAGIYLWRGNFTMTGGSVKVTGAFETGIRVYGNTYRGKAYGGKASITGGSMAATVRKPKENSAIEAGSMTNSVGCLKTIAGRLPKGARFKAGGNTYKVNDYSDVILASYGSKKTKATFNKVTYGKYTYGVTGVGANAFNTKRGKKVKSLVFKNSLKYFGKGAFKNTRSLTSLKMWPSVNSTWKTSKSGKVTVKIKKWDGATYAKGCFSGMGKSKGRGLTLYIGGSKEENAAYRKFMRKYGLPAKVKFGIRRN